MNDLNTLMRVRLADEHPDLDALVSVAVRRGRRIRSVRRAGVGLAAAAVVAGVGLGVGSLTGGAGSTATFAPMGTPSSPGAVVSTALPKADELHAGSVFGLPSGRVAVVRLQPGLTGPRVSPARSFVFVYPTSAPLGDVRYLNRHWPTLSAIPARVYRSSVAVKNLSDVGGDTAAQTETKPAQPTLAGWTCGAAGDEKFTCTGPSGKQAEFVWYPASAYADWDGGDADKTAAWTSEVHGDVFIVINVYDGATTADAQALGNSLVWN